MTAPSYMTITAVFKSDLFPSHNPRHEGRLQVDYKALFGKRVTFQTTGSQTGPIKQEKHQRSQEITEKNRRMIDLVKDNKTSIKAHKKLPALITPHSPE